MMALWSYLIDVQLIHVECSQRSDIQRKLSLQIFHAFCQFVIIIMLAFGGEGGWGMFGWDFAFQVLFTSLLWIFCFSSPTSVWRGGSVCVCGGGMLLSNNTFTTSYLVSGGIWTGYDCLSFIPLLPDGNQLIIRSYSFLDMEQTKFKFSSCRVGRKV